MDEPIQAPHPIVGTWRLISFTETNLDTGTVRHPFGRGAQAIVIYTENGFTATIFTAGGRSPPTASQASDAEAAALYRSMIAFGGRYEVIGSRLTYRPESPGTRRGTARSRNAQLRSTETGWKPTHCHRSAR